MENKEIKKWFYTELYEQMPVSVAVIDPDFKIVEANMSFVQTFGIWNNRHCYEAFKNSSRQCIGCEAGKAFVDGKVRTNRVSCVDRLGNRSKYLVHLFPLVDSDGKIPYIIEMAADTTLVDELQERYELLFDKTPCYISIIDRQFQIFQANRKFRDTFGEPAGKHCHQVYKQSPNICDECPALKVFETGLEHSSKQSGINLEGKETHFMVTAAPLIKSLDGDVDAVLEIAIDVSRIVELENQIKQMFDLQEIVIDSSMDALIVTNDREEVMIYNKSAEKLLGYTAGEMMGDREMFFRLLPGDFINAIKSTPGPHQIDETEITVRDGEKIPVRISGSSLASGDKFLGYAAFIQDLRAIKQLEEEKLGAERLAAVGQTVSGLAHGIKNIITGLEGGLYVMQTGLRKSDVDKIGKGISMLDSNIHRISHFIKEFLNFARGRVPQVAEVNPNDIAREVFELYCDAAKKVGIELNLDLDEAMPLSPMNREGLHACISNLVSNAIDACQMSDKEKKKVSIRSSLVNDDIVFEVIDNGIGIDYEIKNKVFTSFFSTKGSHEGTGLGLLLTKKAVQEHGGYVKFESQPGKGSTFRLEFPRNRLPEPNVEELHAASGSQ